MDARSLLRALFVVSLGLFLLMQLLPIQLAQENEIGKKLQNQSTGEKFSTALLHLAGWILSSPLGTFTTIVGGANVVWEAAEASAGSQRDT